MFRDIKQFFSDLKYILTGGQSYCFSYYTHGCTCEIKEHADYFNKIFVPFLNQNKIQYNTSKYKDLPGVYICNKRDLNFILLVFGSQFNQNLKEGYKNQYYVKKI